MADQTNFSQLLDSTMNQSISSGAYANNTPQTQTDQGGLLSKIASPAPPPQMGSQGGSVAPGVSNGQTGVGIGQNLTNVAKMNQAAAPAASAAPSGGVAAAMPADMMSDERLKTNIKKTLDEDINDFIKTLSPQSFDYKDSQDGSRTEAGIMAQDLEKSKIGSSIVKETPRGKAIDTAKLAPLMAGIFSQKIQELEQKIESSLDAKFKQGKK